ncbi:MAG TPA: stage V sporulation protein SpoVM [Ruminococcaceae bacterium]|nr:stage V sporulation protein SpoVM [Oscillospiraceae bacterium]HCC02708.1 stage V sporulation protein SpoVM [Oscillospiraceae bacterium]HCM23984.1 stage V sporulation protein SpoVM [Oscillospiraceae bacterium]
MEGFSMKIVVVHSPKVIGFFLRKFFHIPKEQTNPAR